MSTFNDHPNAYRSEGPSLNYAPAPKFTCTPTPDQIGRLVYEANQSAEGARVYLNRLERAAESLHGWKATEDQLQGVIDSCRDVEMALAAAIAKLCPEPKARPVPGVKIPLATFEQVQAQAAE